MDRQRRHCCTMVLAGAAALAWPSHAAQSVSVALSARQSLYHLPLMLAERLGYFRQLGLQVALQPHESGHAALGSVLRGQTDVLAGAFEHVFELQRRGQFFQAFAQMTATPMVSLGVVSTRADHRSWDALRGARIGVSALDSGTHWMASLWLQRHGILPSEVNFVEVGTSATALGALWDGQVDALCNPDPVMHWLEQRGELRLIAQARTASGVQQLAGGPLPGGCLIAREDFLARQPQVAQALAQGLMQALRWLQTAGPTDLFKNVPVAPWISDRSVYLGALERLREAYPREVQIREEAVSNAWRQHARASAQLPAPRQQLARTFTNAFAERSRSRALG